MVSGIEPLRFRDGARIAVRARARVRIECEGRDRAGRTHAAG